MNSLQRIRTVLAGGIPDRVPVSLLSFQNAARNAGFGIDEYCLDGKKMAAAQLAYWDVFGQDVIDIENGVAAMAEAVGCEVAYTTDAPPWITRPAIASLAEVGRLPDVDPERSPGLAALLTATRIVSDTVCDMVCVRGESDQGPFDLAAEILGMEQFLLALTDPEQEDGVRRLLEYATAQVARLAQGADRGRQPLHPHRRKHGRSGRLLARDVPPDCPALRAKAARGAARGRGGGGHPHLRERDPDYQGHGDHGRALLRAGLQSGPAGGP